MTDTTMSCISTEPAITADSPIRDELPGNELWGYCHRNPKLLRNYCVKLPGTDEQVVSLDVPLP